MASNVHIKAGTVIVAARITGESSSMDNIARRLVGAVKLEAARDASTGHYMNSIKYDRVRGRSGTGRRVWDRLVYSTDPGGYNIEYGRTYLNEGGDVIKRVPGKYPMTRAIARMSVVG